MFGWLVACAISAPIDPNWKWAMLCPSTGEATYCDTVKLMTDPAYIEENFDSLKSQYQYVRYNEIVESRMGSLSVTESAYIKSLSYGEIE